MEANHHLLDHGWHLLVAKSIDVSPPGRDREGKFYHRALSAVGSATSPRGKHGAPVPAGINAIPFFVWVASALLFALFAQLAILIVIGRAFFC